MSSRPGDGYGIPRKRLIGGDREALEVAIARGVPNLEVMARFGLTYEQLCEVKAEMNGADTKPVPPLPPHKVVAPCGTETAWRRHRRYGQRPCDRCQDAHNEILRRQAEARRVALADRRYRGVA